MNWDFNHHKLYENERMRKAYQERLAQLAREEREEKPRPRRSR